MRIIGLDIHRAFAEAKALVTRYEWLGSMPATPRACYGLKTHDGEGSGANGRIWPAMMSAELPEGWAWAS